MLNLDTVAPARLSIGACAVLSGRALASPGPAKGLATRNTGRMSSAHTRKGWR